MASDRAAREGVLGAMAGKRDAFEKPSNGRICNQKVFTWDTPSRVREAGSATRRQNLTTAESPSYSTGSATGSDVLVARRARRAEQARARRRQEKPFQAVEAFLWPEARTFAVRERKVRDILNNKPILEANNVFKGTVGAQLSLDDICRLEPGRWLTGEVINWAMFSIASGLESVKDRSPCLVYSTDFSSLLMAHHCGEPGPLSKVLRKWHWSKEAQEKGCARRFESYDLIVVPFNVKDTHWCLLTLQPKVRVAKIYNSSVGCSIQETIEIARAIADYAQERVSSDETWIVRTMPGLVQQTNSYDCGVFVCAYVDALLNGRDPSKTVNNGTVRELRARLLIFALELSVKH